MKPDRLIELFRRKSDDTIKPYLWVDDVVLGFLDEAIEQACFRANLILDKFTLTFDSTGRMATCSVMAGDDSIDTTSYKPISAVWAVGEGKSQAINFCNNEFLTDHTNMMLGDNGSPQYLVVDETFINICPVPSETETVVVTMMGYRTPLEHELLVEGCETICVGTHHHAHLLDYALHVAFGEPDGDTFDANRAQEHLRLFGNYFGETLQATTKERNSTNRRRKRNKIY